MRSCGEIDPLITPYVDDEVTPRQRTAVEGHLSGCPVCRGRADAERTVRQVLRARREGIVGRAPEALRARCARPADPPPAAARRRIWLPLAAAATLVLAAGGVLFQGLATRLDASLVAQLTMDHVKCFSMMSPVADSPAPADVEELLRTRFEWELELPRETGAVELELQGARRCHYGDGAVAHVMYRRAGKPVSVFVLEARHADRNFDIMGHQTLLWSKDGRTYALVGEEEPEVMTQLAAFMAPGLR